MVDDAILDGLQNIHQVMLHAYKAVWEKYLDWDGKDLFKYLTDECKQSFILGLLQYGSWSKRQDFFTKEDVLFFLRAYQRFPFDGDFADS